MRSDFAVQRLRHETAHRAAQLPQSDHARRADGGLPGVPIREALSRSDNRNVEMARRKKTEKPNRPATRLGERTQNNNPPVHRSKLRQAVAAARRSAIAVNPCALSQNLKPDVLMLQPA